MFFVLIVLITAEEIHEPVILNIGALFDFEHSSIGESRQELQSAQIAIDEVNRRNEDLFNGLYRLRLIANNSRVCKIKYIYAYTCVSFVMLSVIQFMQLTPFSMQFSVVLNYIFLLVHHVHMKPKLLVMLLIIII